MARPKGSKDIQPRKPRGAAKAADGRPITTDHNKAASVESLTDDQLHKLMMNHVVIFEEALAVKKKADADFKNVCKLIKAEGSSAERVKKFIALGTPAGAAAAKADIEDTIRMAAWRNADVGTQFDFFRNDGAKGSEENASYKAGKEAGLQGESAKPPRQWDANEWLRGHGDGQALNLAQFKQKKEAEEQEFEAAAPSAPTAVAQPQPETVDADDDEF